MLEPQLILLYSLFTGGLVALVAARYRCSKLAEGQRCTFPSLGYVTSSANDAEAWMETARQGQDPK